MKKTILKMTYISGYVIDENGNRHDTKPSRMKLGSKQQRALAAVEAGDVKHAHPFTWGLPTDYLDVSPKTLQRLANLKLIKVIANDRNYWRPVELTDDGRAELTRTKGE